MVWYDEGVLDCAFVGYIHLCLSINTGFGYIFGDMIYSYSVSYFEGNLSK